MTGRQGGELPGSGGEGACVDGAELSSSDFFSLLPAIIYALRVLVALVAAMLATRRSSAAS